MRLLKGTPAQVRALISAGLWVEIELDSGAKAYCFHEWNDHQPTREQKLKERADGAERKRKSRERKRAEQEQRENVTQMSHDRVTRDSHECRTTLSQRPDPTRPDHKKVGVGSSLQAARAGAEVPSPVLDSAGVASPRLAAGGADPLPDPSAGPPPGAEPDLWSTAEDPRCWEHRDAPRDRVPACGACAGVRRWFEDRDRQEVEKTRRDVQECPMCDDRGLVEVFTPSGKPQTVRCDHKTVPEQPKDVPGFRASSSAEARRAALAKLRGRPAPF